MEKLQALLTQLGELNTQLDALVEHDQLTTEQETEHGRLVAEHTKTKAAITRQQASLAREEEAAQFKLQADQAKVAKERREATVVRPTLSTADLPTINGPGVTVVNPNTIPAEARRYGSLKNFRGVVGGRQADERAYRFGMWLQSQLSLQMPNRFHFAGALDFVNRQAVVTSKDASGYGYLIPPEFGTDIIDLRERYGVVRKLFKLVPMDSDTRTDPRRTGGLTANFIGEANAGSESNKTWNQVKLTAKDIMVLSRISAQVNADNVVNWADDMAGEIAYAYSKKEDDCGFNGDGTSAYGGILGARTKLTNCDGAGTASAGLVTAAVAGSWGAITLKDFQLLVGKLPQYADSPEVCWVSHRAFYYGVMQVLELAAGGVTALEVQQGDRRPRPLFLGYPVEFTQIMPAATAASQVCTLFGDFEKGASFGDRQQDAVAFSEHATINGENVFERNEIAVRGTERMDIVVHDAGDSSNPGPIVGLTT